MKKDTQTTEYMKKMESLKLSETSRARIEKSLLEYAQFHSVTDGVRDGEDSRSIEQVSSKTNRRTSFMNYLRNLQKKSMTAALIAILFIAGGGTSYAAQGAAPGDFLYPVKTEINENVRSILAISDESEARLQAQLATERLEEAEELAARGELTAEVAANINSRLKSHVDSAEKRSVQAEQKGNYVVSADVRSGLEGNLRTSANVLSELNERVTGNNGNELIVNINAYANAAANSQVKATGTVSTSTDAQATVRAVVAQSQRIIDRAQQNLINVQAEVSAEVFAQAEGTLMEAAEVQAEAQAEFEAQAYEAAYAAAQLASRLTAEVEALLKSNLQLQLDGVFGTEVELDGSTNVQLNQKKHSQSDQSPKSSSTEDADDESDTQVETNVDAEASADVDADSLDVEVDADTAVRSGLSL